MAKGILGFFFGEKPKVPDAPVLSPEGIQDQTIAGNLSALPQATKLGSQYNQYTRDELAKALEFALPGGLAQIQRNLSFQLSGQMDPEDTRSLIRNATAAGYGRGFGSSFGSQGGIGRNLVFRDLGIGVQQQKQAGFQNFLQLAQQTRAPQLDIGSMFYTPQQRLTFAQNQAENQFNRDWLKSQIEAAPHPAGAFSLQLLLEAVKAAAGSAGAAACHVAREVFGVRSPLWVLFRDWLYDDAPAWFRRTYERFGPLIALAIRPFPGVKAVIRQWMLARIMEKYPWL